MIKNYNIQEQVILKPDKLNFNSKNYLKKVIKKTLNKIKRDMQ